MAVSVHRQFVERIPGFDVVRDAMQLGVVHYIVKPFTFTTLRDRLESYATARQRLADMKHADQREIDRLYGLLRTSSDASLPKGISPPTLTLVASLLRGADGPLSTAEVA